MSVLKRLDQQILKKMVYASTLITQIVNLNISKALSEIN